MLVVIVLTGLYLVQYIRRLFTQLADLSEQRRELAQQLITSQESTFRSISRELHDEFGQILTAIGAILQRADRRASARGNFSGRRSARSARNCAVDSREGAFAFAGAASVGAR